MMSTENGDGRNPLLLIGGFAILGIALALLVFGDSLFGNDQINEPTAFTETTTGVNQIPNLAETESEQSPLFSSGNDLLEVGDTPHNFVLDDLQGNRVSLSDFQGQPIIINFWATWCAPCRIEMPELQAAFEQHADDGLVILALDQDEDPDTVRAFFHDEMGLTFTPLLDVASQTSEQYSVFNFPTTYFVNAEGVITAIHRGPMVKLQIDGYLADTLPSS